MARLSRLQVPGELHVAMWRGHNRQPVFTDDTDRLAFLHALREAAVTHRLSIHSYALLDGEVRLAATPQQDRSLSLAMQAVGRRYVAGFNRRHHRSGTLWEGRYRGALIESEHYLMTALYWIECDAGDDLGNAAPRSWSSAAHHLGAARDPLVVEHRGYWALGNTPFDREAAYRRLLEQGVSAAQLRALEAAVVKGWALGSPAFLARVAETTARPLVARPRGRPRREKPSGDLSLIK
jgi:putative transposase